MKKILLKISLLITLALIGSNQIVSAQNELAITVIDACTGGSVPNYTQLIFRSGTVAAPFSNYTTCNVISGMAYYSPPSIGPDPIGCGHLEATGGATITSTSTTNYYCPNGYLQHITVYLQLANSTSFKINGNAVSTSSGSPTSVYFCTTPTVVLNNTSTGFGEISQYNVTIYNATGGVYKTSGWVAGNSPNSIDLTQSAYFGTTPALGNYSISLQNKFCSGVTQTYTGYINVKTASPSTLNYYFAYAPGSVGSATGIETPSTMLASPSPAGGLISVNGAAATGTIFSYSYTLYQVNASTGANIGSALINVGTTTSSSIPGNINFNSATSPAGYFISNYYTIIGNVYRFTLTINTACGVLSDTGYFKILAGHPYDRMANNEGVTVEANVTELSVTLQPNPVTENARFTINVPVASNASEINMRIADITGRTISENAISIADKQTEYNTTFDMSSLPKGMYIYQVIVGNEVANGKIVKQ